MDIITGRQGSGKTTLMYKKIASLAKGEKVFIVVPEQYTYIAECMLFDKLNTQATSDVCVISLNRLAYKLTGNKGESCFNVLTDEARNMTIRYVIEKNSSELQAFGGVFDRKGFAENVGVIFGEMIKNGITADDLARASKECDEDLLRAKLNDIKRFYENYLAKMGDGFIDKDAFLVKCAQYAQESELISNAHFFFDNFVSFDKSDYEFISAIIKNARSCCFCLTYSSGDLFEVTKRTLNELKKCAHEAGCGVDVTDMGEKKDGPEAIRFIEKNMENFDLPIFEGKDDSVHFNLYSDIFEEVKNTAALIVKLAREEGYRMKDMSVVVSDMNLYKGVIKDVFTKYKIPFFIDARKKIAHSAHVRSLLFIIGSQASFDENDVVSLAKTGFSGVGYDDCCLFENYILQFGIKKKSLLKDFTRNDEKAPYDLDYLNDIRRRILAPVMKYAEFVKGVKTVGEYAKALYSYLEDIGFNDSIRHAVEGMKDNQQLEDANVYAQIYNKIISVIQAMYTFFMEEPYNPTFVYQLLSYAILNSDVGVIPAVEDSISVGDILRSRSADVKALFLLGAAEGKLPTTNISAAIFTDREKQEVSGFGIELVSTSAYRRAKENVVVYSLISKPSKGLYISCPLDDGGEGSAVPCEIFSRFSEVFPNAKAKVEMEDLMCTAQSAFDYISVNLSERKQNRQGRDKTLDSLCDACYDYLCSESEFSYLIKIVNSGIGFDNSANIRNKNDYKKILGIPLNTSVSRLEKYVECPFSFFASYVLKLTERKINRVEIYDKGNIIHRVIEIFSKRILSGEYDIFSMSDEDVAKEAEQICEECLKTEFKNIYSGFTNSSYMVSQLRKLSSAALSEIVRQMRLSDFLLSDSEAGFGRGEEYQPICVDTSEGRVYLRGKIDRVDTCSLNNKRYIKIIDYKTGHVTLDLEKIYFGLSMQLPVYIRTLTSSEGAYPAGVFYLDAHDPLAKIESEADLERIKEKVSENFKLNGILLKDLDVIKALDNNYEIKSFISGIKSSKTSLSLDENVMDEELFSSVIDKAMENVKLEAEKMLKGNISINPCRGKTVNSCGYCKFGSVCKFSTDFSANDYRMIRELDDVQEEFKKGRGERA